MEANVNFSTSGRKHVNVFNSISLFYVIQFLILFPETGCPDGIIREYLLWLSELVCGSEKRDTWTCGHTWSIGHVFIIGQFCFTHNMQQNTNNRVK